MAHVRQSDSLIGQVRRDVVRTVGAVCVGFAVMVGAAGCAAPTIDRDELGVAAEPASATPLGDALPGLGEEGLYPRVGVVRYAATSGWRDGVWWVEHATSAGIGASARAQRTFLVTRRLLDRSGALLETTETRTYEIGETGDVLLRRLVDLRDDVELRFEPPVVVRPAASSIDGAGLSRDGMSTTSIGTVRHIEPATGDVVRTGTVRAESVAVGLYSVELLNGADVRAVELRTEMQMELGPATVRRDVESWFVPGFGRVAARETGSTTVVGVTTRSDSRGMRRQVAEE